MDWFIKKEFKEKLKLAYSIYDRNNDGIICINDVFESMSSLGKYDFFLVNDIASLCTYFYNQDKDLH